jgi:hypothetical protein
MGDVFNPKKIEGAVAQAVKSAYLLIIRKQEL